ncbi:uncharacterized protein [Palaemon carinicauda]|uniref:uncharacterized protein n=1 Tax=Palaemon carinicauda TaxID=392227 RepID=UPI0035B5A0DB
MKEIGFKYDKVANVPESEKTVERIRPKRGQTSPERTVLLPPQKKYSTHVTTLNEYDKCVIRRTEIGFKYAKVDGRKFLIERSDIAAARTTFLQDIQKVKHASQNIVYLDETWVNQNLIVPECWIDTSLPKATGLRQPSGKGNRLIILHAGTRKGFVDNAELVFQANDGDYDKQLFEEWFGNQLLPNISPNSVIVMDNAPYHSVELEGRPTISWKKSDLLDWLIKKGVQPQDNSSKAQLQELAKKIDDPTTYVIDKIAVEAGHRVLRVPPYHCLYNPIELIWTQVKSFIARNTLKKDNLEVLVTEALSLITPQTWMDAVRQAEKIQEKDEQQDIAAENFVESFVTNITECSDEEDDN